jgi:hypothetical protein
VGFGSSRFFCFDFKVAGGLTVAGLVSAVSEGDKRGFGGSKGNDNVSFKQSLLNPLFVVDCLFLPGIGGGNGSGAGLSRSSAGNGVLSALTQDLPATTQDAARQIAFKPNSFEFQQYVENCLFEAVSVISSCPSLLGLKTFATFTMSGAGEGGGGSSGNAANKSNSGPPQNPPDPANPNAPPSGGEDVRVNANSGAENNNSDTAAATQGDASGVAKTNNPTAAGDSNSGGVMMSDGLRNDLFLGIVQDNEFRQYQDIIALEMEMLFMHVSRYQLT